MASEIARKSVTNIFWSFFSFAATKMLNLGAVIILARLLDPYEMGLMAFCMVVMMYLEVFSRFGLGSALISAGPNFAEVADAVFALSIAFSLTISGLLYVSADVIAAFFEQPELTPMLEVLCVALVIEAAATVNNSLLQKDLRFKRKVLPDVARGFTKGCVSIALALMGFGVWSLVYGYLAGALVFGVVLMIVQPWRPKTIFPQRAASRQVLRYGVSLLGAESINMLSRTLPQAMIGKMLGAGPLGLYSLAYRIPDLAIKSFSLVASTVTHPIMAQIRDDADSLRSYFYGCLRYFALLTFPAGVAIAVLTEPMVKVLYTPVWYDMIAPMQYLSIAFALGTLNIMPGAIYKAIMRPDYILKVSLINLPITVGAIWISAPYGLTAVAAAQVALSIIWFVPNFMFLERVVHVSFAEFSRALWPGVATAVVTGAAGMLAHVVVDAEIAVLLLGVVFSGLGFVAALAVVAPEVISEALRRVTPKRAAA